MTDKPRGLIQICTDIYYECETIKRLDELTDEALDWHNKQIVKEDRKGLEVLGAVLNVADGEVTITKSDMIDLDKYVIMNYRNMDGSVTYAVTLKEHKEQ